MPFCIKLVLCLLQCVLSVKRRTNPSNISLLIAIIPKSFGQKLLKWLRSLNVNINRLNNKEILLGMPNCEDELFVNRVLLIAKQYLYFCRCRKTFPIFKVFMSRLRNIQNLELVISKSKNKLSLYTAKEGNFNL